MIQSITTAILGCHTGCCPDTITRGFSPLLCSQTCLHLMCSWWWRSRLQIWWCVGAVCGRTVMGKQGVRQGAQHTSLGSVRWHWRYAPSALYPSGSPGSNCKPVTSMRWINSFVIHLFCFWLPDHNLHKRQIPVQVIVDGLKVDSDWMWKVQAFSPKQHKAVSVAECPHESFGSHSRLEWIVIVRRRQITLIVQSTENSFIESIIN